MQTQTETRVLCPTCEGECYSWSDWYQEEAKCHECHGEGSFNYEDWMYRFSDRLGFQPFEFATEGEYEEAAVKKLYRKGLLNV